MPVMPPCHVRGVGERRSDVRRHGGERGVIDRCEPSQTIHLDHDPVRQRDQVIAGVLASAHLGHELAEERGVVVDVLPIRDVDACFLLERDERRTIGALRARIDVEGPLGDRELVRERRKARGRRRGSRRRGLGTQAAARREQRRGCEPGPALGGGSEQIATGQPAARQPLEAKELIDRHATTSSS